MEMSFKEKCIELRNSGLTLSEIATLTRRPKTSVYFHIRNMGLSSEKVQAIRRNAGGRLREISKARKGKSLRNFLPLTDWTPDHVLLIAHLMFDGEIRRGVCAYNNRSATLIERVERLMKLVYEYGPKRYENKETGVTRIAYFNVELGTHLNIKSQELLESITSAPQEDRRAFLKAFFDDEGCMDFRPAQNKRRVRGYQKDVLVLSLIKDLLSGFDIDSRIEVPNEVVISGKENLRRFEREIGFSVGVRVNGKRRNSIWKESLEKRVLLKRAIDSFRT